jgi:hypothetical protein
MIAEPSNRLRRFARCWQVSRIGTSQLAPQNDLAIELRTVRADWAECLSTTRRPWTGEVAEWLKAHAWNACGLERVSWVRIPPSPPVGPEKLQGLCDST